MLIHNMEEIVRISSADGNGKLYMVENAKLATVGPRLLLSAAANASVRHGVTLHSNLVGPLSGVAVGTAFQALSDVVSDKLRGSTGVVGIDAVLILNSIVQNFLVPDYFEFSEATNLNEKTFSTSKLINSNLMKLMKTITNRERRACLRRPP